VLGGGRMWSFWGRGGEIELLKCGGEDLLKAVCNGF
jgi:hypothetical protein